MTQAELDMSNRNFVYIPKNPTSIEHGNWKPDVFRVSGTLHLFFYRYAEKFLKIQIPLPKKEIAFLEARMTRKIGKAMITHAMAETKEFSIEARKDILREAGIPHGNIYLRLCWGFQNIFLHGGTLEIIGVRYEYNQDTDDQQGDDYLVLSGQYSSTECSDLYYKQRIRKECLDSWDD